MFSSVLVALSLNREPLIYNSLALSALLILIFQPQQLFTASFQMSYAATTGIVYFYNDIFAIFKNVKNKFLKSVCAIFSVTVAAQIPVIAVCMYYFGKVSLISFAANLIVVPLIAIITPLGFVFYFFTFIFSYISLFLSVIISLILHFIIIAVDIFANFKFSVAEVAKPSIFGLVLFFTFLFSITYFKDKKRFLLSAILLIISFWHISVPNFVAKDKLTFNIYRGQNITTLQTINNGLSAFILYQQTNRYDKYYIDSFLQFLSFSAIKDAEILFVGFEKENVTRQIKNRTLDFAQNGKPGSIDLNFEENKVYFDMVNAIVSINGEAAFSMKDNPSFFYYYPDKSFKIKKSRK
jgi:competence protein ComEC